MNNRVAICYWIIDTKAKIEDAEYEAAEQAMENVMRNLIVNGGYRVMNFQDKPPVNTTTN